MGLVDKSLQVMVEYIASKINHPDVGKTNRNEKATQSFWFSKMALVDVKSTTFVVREKGLEFESFLVIPADLTGIS